MSHFKITRENLGQLSLPGGLDSVSDGLAGVVFKRGRQRRFRGADSEVSVLCCVVRPLKDPQPHNDHWQQAISRTMSCGLWLGAALWMALLGCIACGGSVPSETTRLVAHADEDDSNDAEEQRRELVANVRDLADEHGVSALPAAPSDQISDAVFELGRMLAFDKILSGNRDVSCMTCHHPELGSDDDRSLSIGVGGLGLGADRTHPDKVRIPRNAPALFNLHAFPTMFWDSRVAHRDGELSTPAGEQLTPEMLASLQFGVVSAQALFPVTSREEMRGHVGENELADVDDSDLTGIWRALMARLGAIPRYVELFERAYPGRGFAEMSFADAANAIAAFEIRAFEAINSPWQRFVRGDDEALTIRQLRGARRFFNSGCASCHAGPSLSDFGHHNTALAQFGPGKGDGRSGRDDFGRYRETGDLRDLYAFRTPPLFNVELTAPYGHAGQYADLRRHVEHYVEPGRSLFRYDIRGEVADEALHDTQLFNRWAVLLSADREIFEMEVRGVGRIVDFLQAQTDPASLDLRSLVPDAVPSGLPVAD